jgi:hypothetical protein
MSTPGYIGQDEAREICMGLIRKSFDLYDLVELENIWGEKEYLNKVDRSGRLDSEMATNYLKNLRTAFEKRLRLYSTICTAYTFMETFEELGIWTPEEKLKKGLKEAIDSETIFLSEECTSSLESQIIRKIGSLLEVDRKKEAESNK